MTLVDKTVYDLTAIVTPATGDLTEIVDVSDHTDTANGSSKKSTLQKLSDLFESLILTAAKIKTALGISTLSGSNTGDNATNTTYSNGWILANEDWTYASASTITVPAGATSKYGKGDRIKWTQTTIKYGVIITVADTLLTIATTADYTVTDAAITLNYYSHEASPIGYPHWFSWIPTWTLEDGTLNTTYSTRIGKFCVNGRNVTARFYMILAVVTEATADRVFRVNYPITPVYEATYSSVGSALFLDSGTDFAGLVISPTSTSIMTFISGDTGLTNFFGVVPAKTLATDDAIGGTLTYEI